MDLEILKKHESLYYEFTFGKHCYKFETPETGYLCVMNENEQLALECLVIEINKSLSLLTPKQSGI